ncbi:hypothetical protein CALVIDRAFT_539279 [Calocera viscosa TUFC12733]|uniref:Uncharacterized protein n=1 Tax=Calocera viscosa (strain TUFC12733) TaxID=1330018 RepID=A0A167K470_CALVF|nr:hypothetical protein CALVIDRAFT_539279 [Calocera viscosa TUFC12733]
MDVLERTDMYIPKHVRHVTAYIVNGEVINRDSTMRIACATAGVLAPWRAHQAWSFHRIIALCEQ